MPVHYAEEDVIFGITADKASSMKNQNEKKSNNFALTSQQQMPSPPSNTAKKKILVTLRQSQVINLMAIQHNLVKKLLNPDLTM